MALKYAFLSTQETFSALVQTEIKLTNKKKLFYNRTANFTIIITIVRHLSEKIIINKDLTSRMSLKKKDCDNNNNKNDNNNNTTRASAFLSMARRGAVSRLMLYLVNRVDVFT